jgi:hypothetical protein
MAVGRPCSVEVVTVHASELSLRPVSASGWIWLAVGGQCIVEVVHASELPVCHFPAACWSRLAIGGPCSVEVVHASELPVCHFPAACWNLLAVVGQYSVEVVHASELPVRQTPSAGKSLLPIGRTCSGEFVSASDNSIKLCNIYKSQFWETDDQPNCEGPASTCQSLCPKQPAGACCLLTTSAVERLPTTASFLCASFKCCGRLAGSLPVQ